MSVLSDGSLKVISSLAPFYSIWKKSGEKLGLGEDLTDNNSSTSVDETL
jgi:hypothetical protein